MFFFFFNQSDHFFGQSEMTGDYPQPQDATLHGDTT